MPFALTSPDILLGLLALQNAAYTDSPAWPLDILVAESQGMIGSAIAQELTQYAGSVPVSTLMTRVEVDANDPAFSLPGKYIGPVYQPEQQAALEARYGWTMKADGKYIRRVVPSPLPLKIVDDQAIAALMAAGHVVICCGGGGIPVIAAGPGYQGTEAVLHKDPTAAAPAPAIPAGHLLDLTHAHSGY